MIEPTSEQSTALADAVRLAAVREDVADAVHAVYDDLQKQIDLRRPLCVISGRCCRFEEFGHRLYVTTLELAAFLRDVKPPTEVNQDPAGCPFQINKLCGVHNARPFGCRIFFCDATAADWQQDQYEIFHARLKALHEMLGVPYFYVEWRSALKALGLMR